MRYYGNVMTTTRWRLYVILHLQQYSRRLNLFFFSEIRAVYDMMDKKLRQNQRPKKWLTIRD